MPGRTFSLILSVVLLTFCISRAAGASGAAGDVWGMDRDEFLVRLQVGDYEFLRHRDIADGDPTTPTGKEAHRAESEVWRLGDEGPYMLGLIYEGLGLPGTAERMYRLSWEAPAEPWHRQALGELLRLLTESERYGEVEQLAREGIRRYGDEPDLSRRLLDAYYRQQKDSDLLAFVRSTSPPGSETALWVAVASSRENVPGWADRYRELFADYPADASHTRVWLYLRTHPDLSAMFTPVELQFFEAKHLLSAGDVSAAVERFSAIADAIQSDGGVSDAGARLLLSPSGLRDFYLAGSRSGRQTVTAERMIAIAPYASGDGERAAWEYAGRLYRTAGNYPAAIAAFERSLTSSPAGPDAERRRWYLLSSRVRLDPAGTARALSGLISSLGAPGYYDDLFGELAGKLAEAREWESLATAYTAIRGFATPGALATYELMLAEAQVNGLIAVPDQGTGLVPAELLTRAASQRQDRFSALVAEALLGSSGEAALDADSGDSRMDAGVAEADPAAGEADVLVAGYLRFGLIDRAYAQVSAEAGKISRRTLGEVTDRLALAGRIRESIQVAARIPVRSAPDADDGISSDETLRRRYPRGFAAVFDEVLAEEPLDPCVLYALVREESLFDPDIVSAAGAIGLTQLLPSTAADVAARLRIGEPDLTDPLANLRIGARYLTMLTGQFGSLVKALAAYNAGQGRVRSWERAQPGLDGVLFHQAIPFEETYEHIRNIVVSASYYGYLYGGRTPTETIHTVFGNFPTVYERGTR